MFTKFFHISHKGGAGPEDQQTNGETSARSSARGDTKGGDTRGQPERRNSQDHGKGEKAATKTTQQKGNGWEKYDFWRRAFLEHATELEIIGLSNDGADPRHRSNQ